MPRKKNVNMNDNAKKKKKKVRGGKYQEIGSSRKSNKNGKKNHWRQYICCKNTLEVITAVANQKSDIKCTWHTCMWIKKTVYQDIS